MEKLEELLEWGGIKRDIVFFLSLESPSPK